MIRKIVISLLLVNGIITTMQPLYNEEGMLNNNGIFIQTGYGEFFIHEPVLIELLHDPLMQRLKLIRQYGANYFVKKQEYNRYDHSVGVFLLLRRFGASLEEQIAGLLHDASHTVFSHVGDFLFKVDHLSGNSYQDIIHKKFIKKSSLGVVLKRHGFAIKDIIHKNGCFKALEQDLPALCADRLEYNLAGGLLEGLITQEDVTQILDALVFEDGKWIFTTLEIAQKFAQLPLYLTTHVWGSPKSIILNQLTSDALERGLDLGLLTLDDIHYGTDDIVWQKLRASDDKQIQNVMHHVDTLDNYFTLGCADQYDCIINGKFRGIDPYVRVGNAVLRLSGIDVNFSNRYYDTQCFMNKGWYIKFLQK